MINLQDEQPVFSIIMPLYNRGYIVRQAIESVKKQSYALWELIIVDDGSTDETEQLLSKETDGRIYYIRLSKNHGANYARNIGLRMSKGNYIAFLDSDNVWSPQYLEKRLELFCNKAVDMIFGYVDIEQEDGRSVVWPPYEIGQQLCKRTYLEKNLFMFCPLDLNALCISKQCYVLSGGFDEALSCGQDWDLFSKYIRKGHSYYFDKKCLVKGKIQKNSIKNIDVNRRWNSYSRMLLKNMDYITQTGSFLNVLLSMLKRDDIKYADPEQIEANLTLLCNNQHLYLLEQMQKMELQQRKSNRFYGLLVKWVKIKQKNINISSYFISEKVKHIAIYGMKELGQLLYDELINTEIHIDYVIDKNPKIQTDSRLISPENELPEVDMIVVTAIFYYEEIRGFLQNRISARIISLLDILIDLEKEDK